MTAIELDGVAKRYRSGEGISDVTFTVEPGEVFGFLGPNGAGKSTTIRLIMDLIRPDTGSIRVLGRDVRRDGLAVRSQVGYLPGELSLYEQLTARQVLEHLRALRPDRTGRSIDELADRLRLDLDRSIKELSRGNKQKVGLVQALMGNPTVVILDEPTSGLDPLIQREVRLLMRELADEGAAVLLSSHVLSEVSDVADRVAIIRAGSIVAIETVEGLRSRAVRRIEVRTAVPMPAGAFDDVPGATLVHAAGTTAIVEIVGSMDPMVKRLAAFDVVDLVAGEPDLEQVFLSFYESVPVQEVSDAA